MTNNLSTQRIKNLFNNGDIKGAWKLHKKLVYEYVSNQPYYLSKCKKVEILYPGETFISNVDLLYKNEFSRSLFEDWIQNYWDIHDRYNYSAPSALLVNEKNDLEYDTIVDHVNKCWSNEDYDHNFSYLHSQFEARGEEISSPGNSVVRKIHSTIEYTLIGPPAFIYREGNGIRNKLLMVWKPYVWSNDIGLRLGFEKILFSFIEKYKNNNC